MKYQAGISDLSVLPHWNVNSWRAKTLSFTTVFHSAQKSSPHRVRVQSIFAIDQK